MQQSTVAHPVVGTAGRVQAVPSSAVRVRDARVEMLLDRSESPLWTGLALSLLIASFVWSETPHRRVLGWLGLRLVAAGIRASLHVAYRRRKAHEPILRWERPYLIALALDGFVWSLVATWLPAPDRPATVAAALAVVVCIGAVASYGVSAHGWGYVAFTFSLLLPVIGFHLLQPGKTSLYGALFVLAYLTQSALDVRHSWRATRELSRLRHELGLAAEQRAGALTRASQGSESKLRFLTKMSHEMRTPLHGILGTVRLLKRRHTMGEDRVLLESTERSGSHLLRLIDDVLDFAKLGHGGIKFSERPFDCVSVVGDAVASLRSIAGEKGIDIVSASDSVPSLKLRGDALRYRQIVLNLVGNAIKFMQQGTIETQLTVVDSCVVLTVRDQGVGIAAGELERIFEPFRQVDDSLGRPYEGTGLGLAISRDIARAMGGDLVCTESRPGEGSTFRLQVPFTASVTSVAPASHPPSSSAASFKGRVMLVDDNGTNAILGRAILEELGVEVDVYESGFAAVEASAVASIDLIFMDCQMPGLDGLQATRMIRERERERALPAVPIVALTAHSAAEDRERCLQAGMDDYLAKPFRIEEIEGVLSRFLATRSSGAEDGT